MSLRQKYLAILSGIVPLGVVGVSLLLGSTAPSAASQEPMAAQPRAADQARVSERLAAIRDAVSEVAEPGSKPALQQLAWGNWRNGGWHGGWRNGGWRNVGWRNGGWHNGWHNWWRNW